MSISITQIRFLFYWDGVFFTWNKNSYIFMLHACWFFDSHDNVSFLYILKTWRSKSRLARLLLQKLVSCLSNLLYFVKSLLLCAGNQNVLKYTEIISFVHTDDVANAHIFLFECPNAKGRYICSAVEITVDNLAKFLSTRYPEFQIRNEEWVLTPILALYLFMWEELRYLV